MTEPVTPEPDNTSSRRKLWIVLAVVVVLAGAAVYYGRQNESNVSVDLPKSVTVIYKVDGTARTADITYATPSGTSQQQGVDVPLRKKSDSSEGIEVSMFRGDHLYISAQNNGSGTITCHILVDGREVASNTSSGEYAIASCSA